MTLPQELERDRNRLEQAIGPEQTEQAIADYLTATGEDRNGLTELRAIKAKLHQVQKQGRQSELTGRAKAAAIFSEQLAARTDTCKHAEHSEPLSGRARAAAVFAAQLAGKTK